MTEKTIEIEKSECRLIERFITNNLKHLMTKTILPTFFACLQKHQEPLAGTKPATCGLTVE